MAETLASPKLDEVEGTGREPVGVDREEAGERARERRRDVRRGHEVSALADGGAARVVPLLGVEQRRLHEVGEGHRPFARDALAEPVEE